MSTHGSFIATPIKSSIYRTGESLSPKKTKSKVFKSTIVSSTSHKPKPDTNESAQGSLIFKLIENQISSQEKYQNILIQNKQLEIKVLALQQEAQRLRKDFKKANTPIEELKNKILISKSSLIQKQKYLEKFYLHLDAKLKSNKLSNLFGRLDNLQRTLEKKYLEQKEDLYLSISNQHQKVQSASLELQRLCQYRDQLIKVLTQRAIQVSSQNMRCQNFASSIKTPSEKKSHKKSSYQVSQYKKSTKSWFDEAESMNGPISQNSQNQVNSKRQKQRVKQQYNKQCKYLKENIEKLKKQKQIVQKDEKLLKLLLNIDQQHKKYSAFILGGFKKMFTIKYREILLKRKRQSTIKTKSDLKNSEQESMPDIQGTQKELNQKVAQRKILQKEIQQRNISLQNLKQKLNQQIAQYSLLEQQIMQNKNSSKKTNKNFQNQSQVFHPRSTYTGNLSMDNHRSTYTSYQKRSQRFQQDL